MKTPTPTLPINHAPTITPDTIQRISLAVRELDKLVDRANQLASLSAKPFPTNDTMCSSSTPQQHDINSEVSHS